MAAHPFGGSGHWNILLGHFRTDQLHLCFFCYNRSEYLLWKRPVCCEYSVCRHCVIKDKVCLHFRFWLILVCYWFSCFPLSHAPWTQRLCKAHQSLRLLFCYVNLTCCVFCVFLFLTWPLPLLGYLWLLLATAVSCEYIYSTPQKHPHMRPFHRFCLSIFLIKTRNNENANLQNSHHS